MREGVRVTERSGGMGRWMLSKNINARAARSRVRMNRASQKGHTEHLREGPLIRLSGQLLHQRCGALWPRPLAKARHPCGISDAMENQRDCTRKGYSRDL